MVKQLDGEALSSITDRARLQRAHMEIEGDRSAWFSTCETQARSLHPVLDSAV